MLPQSHMAACAWQEPWGLRRPSASWRCPAGVMDHCWSSWLCLQSCTRSVSCVFLLHVQQGESTCHIISLFAISLCMLEREQSIASVYKLFIIEIMGGFVVDYMRIFHIVLQEWNRSSLINSEKYVSAPKMRDSHYKHVEIYFRGRYSLWAIS